MVSFHLLKNHDEIKIQMLFGVEEVNTNNVVQLNMKEQLF